MLRVAPWLLGVLAFCSACSGGPDETPAGPSEQAKASDAGRETAVPAVSYQTLIQGEWSVEPGAERYVCVRHTLTEDVFVGAFAAINPVGTHHTVLTMGDPDEPDGTSDCTAANVKARILYGSGVGTDPLEFPEGLAVRLTAGSQLLLNLHLFNASTEAITGVSGTRVSPVPEAAVEHETEALLAANFDFQLPPGAETVTVASCTMDSDVTVVTVGPHMHQLGTHAKIVAERAGGEQTVLHDAPYDFDLQLQYMIDPIQIAQGDKIFIECTYRNDTDRTVGFGDSSQDEMCQVGFYRYPANGASLICPP